MSIPLASDDPVTREWQSLSRKLSHARGFCFIVFFVRDQRLALALKRRLGDDLSQRQSGLLQTITVDEPGALVADSMAPLFQPAAAGSPRRVFWLEAFRGAGQPDWDTARDQLLMRLNERRSRLENEVREPLVLLLPADAQRSAATLAPDLWHIRVHSATLESTAPVGARQPFPERGASAALPRSSAPVRATDTAGATPTAAKAPREVLYWREQQRAVADEQAQPLALPAPAAPALWDGFAAFFASLEHGRFDEAQGLADELRKIATALWQSSSGEQRIEAESNLAQAHAVAGLLANVQGQFNVAAASLQQAVAHMRAVMAARGRETVVADRSTLAAQLNQLGNALKGLDRVDEAGHMHEEAVLHARVVAQQPDADANALDALAVSLSNVGEIYRLRGAWDQAAAVFTEALELVRTALRTDASAARRRLLGVALFKRGLIDEHQGRLDQAASAFSEVLEMDRLHLAEAGPTPQALDDVATDLEALAKLDGQSHERQLAAAAEALDLRTQQVALFPSVEPFRHALERARQTFDNLQSSDPQAPP